MNKKLGYNERLMEESLRGNDYALDELMSNAGAGSAEAQYYLALFYERTGGIHDPDYSYWIEKSKKNGYVPGVGVVHILTPEQLQNIEAMSFKIFIKTLIFEYRILICLGVFG